MTAFDLILIALVFGSALYLHRARDLFQAVLVFITFGLLISLVWVRLKAPDVALAEAAIGAGLMGVFLLDSLLSTTTSEPKPATTPSSVRLRLHLAGRATLLILCCSGALLCGKVLVDAWPPAGALGASVSENLAESGVSHSVTAVLLNFRFFDTWLELAVLWAAVLALLAARGTSDVRKAFRSYRPTPVLSGLVGLLFPLTLLCSGYLLWLGKTDSGGAFQAGVVLGAGLILLCLSGRPTLTGESPERLRWLTVLGFVSFMLLAAATRASGRQFAQFDPEWAGLAILIIESLAAVSIAVSLPFLLAALRPDRSRDTLSEAQK